MPIWLAFIPAKFINAALSAGRYLLAHPMTLATIVFAFLWRVEAHERATCNRARAQAVSALQDAVAASGRAKAAYEQRSKDNADASDRSHAAIADAGRVAVAAWIAGHRLPASVPAVAPGGQGNGAAVSSETAPVPTVAVPESVVTTCDAAYSYALSAYLWAQTLNEPTQ